MGEVKSENEKKGHELVVDYILCINLHNIDRTVGKEMNPQSRIFDVK